ncbi:MAG: hypothetical protein U1A78_10810 [Polyangia bacterium]
MHPRRVIGPLVLFSGACATAPPTPSSTFLARAEEVPPGHTALLPAYADAYAAWLLPPTNVWARYSKSTLLAALGDAPMAGVLPDTGGLSIVHRAEAAAARLASAGLPADTLIVVDLRGAAAVAFGNALSHRAAVPVSLVLTFNNWPAPREVVPAEETLAALVSMRPRAIDPNERSSRPVLLLDAWRLAYRDSQPDDEAYDNRYALGPADLPDAATLVQQGIRSVLYVVEHRDSDTVEEDDLHASFTAYQQAGLSLHLADLADLGEAGDSASFSRCLVRTRYSLRPRATLLSSPAFFMRSRGGFGGPHARPSHIGYSRGFHGPSHGHGHSHGHGGFRGGGHGG